MRRRAVWVNARGEHSLGKVGPLRPESSYGAWEGEKRRPNLTFFCLFPSARILAAVCLLAHETYLGGVPQVKSRTSTERSRGKSLIFSLALS